MTLNDFFDRLLLKKVVPSSRHAVVDNRPYAAFRTLEVLTVDTLSQWHKGKLCSKHDKWFEKYNREIRRSWRYMLGATILVMAEQKASSLQRTSAIARAMPYDDVVWEQVKGILMVNQLEESK